MPPDTPDLEQRQELGPAPDVQPESDLMRAYEFTAPESATPPASGPHAGAAEAAEQEPASPSHAGRPQRPDPDAPRPWAPAASSVPVPRLALSAETQPAKSQESVGLEAPARGLPGAAEDRKAVPPAPPPAPPPLQEPWWLIALDTVRSNRKAQIGAAGALAALVLLGSWMWPHGTGTTPISRVRRYPAQYDGRNVAVRGRVGDDVFPVGDGWAFYLLQGRDTMVTFSRVRSPRPHDVVTVKGLVSVGFLDGVPRQAMFEESAAPK